MSDHVHVLGLRYSINFHDSDEGSSYAGEGYRLISVHAVKTEADAIAAEFNPVFALAEKNPIIYPMQKDDRKLKEQFGFTVHDIDEGYNFRLVVETFPIDTQGVKS